MTEDEKIAAIADRQIDYYSVTVIGWNRRDPGGKKLPADMLAEIAERMDARDEQRAARKKLIEGLKLTLTVAAVSALVATYWAPFIKWTGH